MGGNTKQRQTSFCASVRPVIFGTVQFAVTASLQTLNLINGSVGFLEVLVGAAFVGIFSGLLFGFVMWWFAEKNYQISVSAQPESEQAPQETLS